MNVTVDCIETQEVRWGRSTLYLYVEKVVTSRVDATYCIRMYVP